MTYLESCLSVQLILLLLLLNLVQYSTSCIHTALRLSHTSDLKIGPPVACQVPGVIGSVLGLVGLMSVYCDWVRCNFYLSVAACTIV